MAAFTKCWDCANANAGCEWSKEGKPVKGWIATYIKANGTKPYDTYFVHDCPQFKRDAYEGGTRRLKREIKLEKKR